MNNGTFWSRIGRRKGRRKKKGVVGMEGKREKDGKVRNGRNVE